MEARASCSNDFREKDCARTYLDGFDLQEIADGFFLCESSLRDEKILIGRGSGCESGKSRLLGQQFANSIKKVLKEFEFCDEDECFVPDNESDCGNLDVSVTDSCVSDGESAIECSEAESSESESENNRNTEVPFAVKEKIVTVSEKHPTWRLKSLRQNGCSALKSLRQLRRWKADVKKKKNTRDSFRKINNLTFERFQEARSGKKPVSTRNLKQWACAAATALQQTVNFKFKASESWAKKFKAKFKIRQRKVTRFIKSKNAMNKEEIARNARTFQKSTAKIIKSFDPHFVINTDQTGCEFQIPINRTLSYRGEKSTEVFLGNFSKVTHSYTAQYCITAAGELLPKVFLCLQEVSGSFGPRVQVTVDNLVEEFGNVYATASKSGKLSKQHVSVFAEKIIAPYVGSNDFLLILDSWGGQTEPALFHSLFTNDDGDRTSHIEVIPPHCTDTCQPLDVYFHRQLKAFIKKLQHDIYLLQNNRAITTREDAIKIHSLIQNQFSAPIFEGMIKFAWILSNLIEVENREAFKDINEVLFSDEVLKNNCAVCEKLKAFIQCSRCRKFICFPCFYDQYHPRLCN